MSRKNRVDRLLLVASSQIGYRSRAAKVNVYGAALGTDGQTWAGSFIETVLRDSGELGLPNLNHTTSALAEFIRTGRNFRVPKRGDLVFFGYSTDGPFTQPHVGIVTDVSGWRADGVFRAISGQQQMPAAKGPKESDGVYERTHFSTEVLAFIRPKYNYTPKSVEPANVPIFRPAQFQPGKVSKATITLQTALNRVNGATGMKRGLFDAPTRAALAAYQRKIGYGSDSATGLPDTVTLKRLAFDTDYVYFQVAKDTP